MGRKNKIHIVEIVKNILTKKALSRNADEILLKEAEYEDKIWYTRHIALKQSLLIQKSGKITCILRSS